MVIYLINLLNHRIIGNNYYTLNLNKYTSRALPKDPDLPNSWTSPALVMAIRQDVDANPLGNTSKGARRISGMDVIG